MNLGGSPLGAKSVYIDKYTPSLLFPISRKSKRKEIGVSDILPFYGYDQWNAFELSWLNKKGKPRVAIAKIDIDCDSINIIESKSFKLYLNSFNNEKFCTADDVQSTIERDITEAINGEVKVSLYFLETYNNLAIKKLEGECIDILDIECNCYIPDKNILSSSTGEIEETLYSNFLKSNCLVTGQPDWGSLQISYKGAKINKENLLKYIISFRNHNEFHEQCVERIFMDIKEKCNPSKLTVYARYTRRGGLDINPIRSTEKISPPLNIRLIRQ